MKKLIFLFLFSFSVYAETFDYQIWAPVNINVAGPGNWKGFLELQPRIGNDSSQLTTAIVRPAVGYQIHQNWTLWAGYLMQATSKPSDLDEYDIENRSWQGLTYKDTFNKNFILDVRNRLEQRFLPHNGDIQHRWRTRIRGEYLLPIDHLSIIGSNEIFFNLNDNENNHGLQTGVDQDRAYIGVGYRFAPEFQIETGYLKQYSWGYNGKQNGNNDVWMTNFNINI